MCRAGTCSNALPELAEALPEHARDARAEFAATFGDNQLYDRFEEVIADRCKWTLSTIASGG